MKIQSLWSKLADIPDDAEAALDFWINHGSCDLRLTDMCPRGKRQMLINARILFFNLLADWEHPVELARKRRKIERSQNQPSRQKNKNSGKSGKKISTSSQVLLSGEQIASLRKDLQISQRTLAEKIGKSQSWIRDVENGRFQAKHNEQQLIRQALKI